MLKRAQKQKTKFPYKFTFQIPSQRQKSVSSLSSSSTMSEHSRKKVMNEIRKKKCFYRCCCWCFRVYLEWRQREASEEWEGETLWNYIKLSVHDFESDVCNTWKFYVLFFKLTWEYHRGKSPKRKESGLVLGHLSFQQSPSTPLS